MDEIMIQSSEFFAGLSIVLTALSLIVSVVGWSITYKRQKDILERQIAADIEKEKLSLSLTTTLSELERVRIWVDKGFKILDLIRSMKTDADRTEIIRLKKEWDMKANEIINLSLYLDARSKTTRMRDRDDYLQNFTQTFTRGISSEYKKTILGEDVVVSDYEIDIGFDALDRIDILKREAFGQPIPNYGLTYKIGSK